MLPLVIVLLTPAPPVPVEVEAERVEVTPTGWTATGVTLATPAGRLDAAAAEGHPTPACPQGAVTLSGGLTLATPPAALTAADATLCLPGGALTARGARLDAPRLRAGAAAMVWRDGALDADDAWFTACGCDDPPWTVHASSATLHPGEGAWATWPVLHAGGVPVLAAPVAYVPLARRRTGFLLPVAGYDADDGLWARLPLFLALGQSLDLTLSPGWRDGFTLDGRVRWAASPIDDGVVDGGYVTPDGGFVAGRGSAPVGPLRLALDGQWADSGARWRSRRPGFIDRTRATLTAEASAAAAGDGVAIGLRTARLMPIEPGDDRRPVADVAPELWTAVSAALGPLAVGFDALLARYALAGVSAEVFDLGVDAGSTHWLGPLRLRPLAGARTRIHPAAEADDAGSGQRLAGFVAAEAELAVARRYPAGRHVVALTADARLAGVETEGSPPVLDARDRPVDSRAVGVALSTRFTGARWSAEGRARLDYEAEAPIEGLAAPWIQARLDGPWVGFDVDLAGADALLAGLRAGPLDGPRIELRWLRFAADPALPWLRARGPVLPVQQVADEGRVDGLTGAAALAIGPLDLRWQGAFDLGRAAYVGQLGELRWQGRCDCWSAGVWLGHEAGRAAPDVMLTLTLGAGDQRGPASGSMAGSGGSMPPSSSTPASGSGTPPSDAGKSPPG